MKNKNQSHTNSPEYVKFNLGDEVCALPKSQVQEVIQLHDLTVVPHAPSYFLGVMNLRGQKISVMDLREKFGMKKRNHKETTTLICDVGNRAMGIVVDSVRDATKNNDEDILVLDLKNLFPDAPKSSLECPPKSI